jgi:UTP--glucose-1-phosphate uridylyltransferase
MAIKKAVFPVAGLGTRFLPATKAQPKEMLPIVDKPTIQYVMEEALQSGVDDFLFVTGRDKRPLEDYFDHAQELEHHLAEKGKTDLLELVRNIACMCQIYYVRQKKPLGLGHAVYCARQHIESGYFAVLLGDDIVVSDTPCLAQMIEVHEMTGKAVIAVRKVPRESVRSYGIIDGSPFRNRVWEIKDLVEKPSPESAPSDMAVIGRYILPASIFPVLENLKPGVGGEIQLTDALRELAKNGELVGCEFEGIRYDVGEPKGYLKATIELALGRDDLGPYLKEYLAELVVERGFVRDK